MSPRILDLFSCAGGAGVGYHRAGFEVIGVDIDPQPRYPGWRHGAYFDGPYFAVHGDGGGKGTVAEWQTAMGIDWTDVRREIAEAIPPAYTEHIGAGLLAAL